LSQRHTTEQKTLQATQAQKPVAKSEPEPQHHIS